MSEERLLTEAELLEALNIQADRTAVWRWRKQGMPHVKVGRSSRYDLKAVQEWLQHRTKQAADWQWSVWTWVPEGRRPSGEIEPAFWYEECRCRNQIDAENIMKLLQQVRPSIPVRVSMVQPEGPPDGSA